MNNLLNTTIEDLINGKLNVKTKEILYTRKDNKKVIKMIYHFSVDNYGEEHLLNKNTYKMYVDILNNKKLKANKLFQ